MLCPVHNVEFKTVPAGVSKSTGRPYNAFLACPERGCNEKPPRAGYSGNTGQNYPRAAAAPTPARNFEREAYEKCCTNWCSALISKGMTLTALNETIETGKLWDLFQNIKKDGEKRFSGMETARAKFTDPLPVIQQEDEINVEDLPFN